MTGGEPIRQRAIAAIAGLCLLAACTGTSAGSSVAGTAEPASASGGNGADQAAAEAYCTTQGGALVDRIATWNTNGDPSQYLPLGGHLRLCEFEMGTGDQTTRASIDLQTLYTQEPTLAAVAYLSKIPPPQPPQIGMNPGEYDCNTALGGAAAFGNTASGGGWVDQSQPVFKVMNLCVFADMSAIDEFAIFYYATGAVRGADLSQKMRYQPGDTLPAMFERQR